MGAPASIAALGPPPIPPPALLGAPAPELPLLPPLVATPLPLQPHEGASWTHVKPSPQSASTVHGGTYLGTHADTVVVVHGGGGVGVVSHFVLGAHDGAVAGGQLSCVCE
jgi:hypothetical protein